MPKPQGIIIVAGPTASGKSELAINLAQEFGGELVCSDSMQVYRQLDIGTAKPTLKEQKLIPHHQIDLINPDEYYSAGKYEKEAIQIISEIQSKGSIPILVGGAGLYFRALMYGISQIPPIPLNIREKVACLQSKKGNFYCWEQLQKHDPQGTKNLHPNDTARIIRSLEVFLATGISLNSFQKKQPFAKARYPFIALALDWDRTSLYERINNRTLKMLKIGWIEEVEELIKNYSINLKPFQSIGYKEIVHHLNNHLKLENMIQEIQQRTRRYAKRQLTWFKKESKIEWLKPNDLTGVLNKIKLFLEK